MVENETKVANESKKINRFAVNDVLEALIKVESQNSDLLLGGISMTNIYNCCNDPELMKVFIDSCEYQITLYQRLKDAMVELSDILKRSESERGLNE